VDNESLAHPLTRKIALLEERYRHELMSAQDRLELREHMLRLKAKGRTVSVL